MRTRYLTKAERELGQKYFNIFELFNGAGYSFLGDTIVYLLAIQFGAGNIQLGYISSAIFIAGFVLPFVPRFLAGKNIVAAQSIAWYLRGFTGLGYVALFFIEGRPAVYLILLLYTFFCVFRMVGVVLFDSSIKRVSVAATRGKVLAQLNINFQSTMLLSKFFSFLLSSISFFSGLFGLLLMQAIGIISNTFAALFIGKVPSRDVVEYKKGENLFFIFKRAIVQKHHRTRLLLKWFNIAVTVLTGLTVPYLRRGIGFDTSMIFLYTMGLGFASILSSMYTRTFGDRVGSRPLLIGGVLASIVTLIAWTCIPPSTPFVVLMLLGFFTHFFLGSNNILITRLIFQIMPEDENVGYNSMINFFIAVFALFFGFAGGWLIDLGQGFTLFELPNRYSLMFLLDAVLGIVVFGLALHVKESGSLSSRDTADIFLSIDGFRAYMAISKLDRIKNPTKRKTVLLSIGMNANSIATSEITSILSSPLTSAKAEMIKALFDHPRPALLPYLMEEAESDDSYNRIEALFALGAYSGKQVEQFLLKIFREDPDPLIRSNAAKSLGRVHCRAALPEIREQMQNTKKLRERMNYIIGLKNLDPSGSYLRDIFEAGCEGQGWRYRQTIYSLYAEMVGAYPSLADIYKLKNQKIGSGIRDFLDETRDIPGFFTFHKELVDSFMKESWAPVWAVSRDLLERCEVTGWVACIKEAILTFINRAEGGLTAAATGVTYVPDYDDALAVVYFTYTVLHEEFTGIKPL